MIKKTIKILFVVMALFFLISCQTNNNNYAVVFKDEDGSILKTEVVQHGNDATPPVISEKEGKIFINWDASYQKNIKDTVITAVYEAKTYKARVLKDGVEIDSQNVKHGEAATPPQNKDKEGYTFTGYSESLENIKKNTDINLEYEINKYEVKFYSGETLLKTDIVNYLETATPPEDPIKEGHTFKGWSLSYQEVKSNLDVYAQFEINKYTVRFLVEGTLIDEVEVSHGNTATTDKPVTKDGYDHIGWDKDPTNITTPTDLNAVFKKKVYTVTFKDDDVTLVVRNVEHGEDAIPSEEPQKDNFIFDGLDTPFTNVTSNLVVKATYKPDPYTITFTGLTKEGVLSWNPVPGETRFDVKIDEYETGAYSNSISLSAGAIGVASRHTKVTVSVGEYRGVTYVDRYGNQDYSFSQGEAPLLQTPSGFRIVN